MGRFDFKTRTGQISPIIQTLSALTFDTDAQAFFNRVTAAGGALNSTELIAINDLVLNMKSAGIWNSMKAIYPMVGASAAACSQNLKSSSFTGTFSSGWTFASTGVTPNGTSAFMNTNLNSFTQLNPLTTHLSTYIRTNSNVGAPYDIGNSTDTAGNVAVTLLITRYSNNLAYIAIADNSFSTNTVSTNSIGFWCGATNGSIVQTLYKNGTSQSTNNQVGGVFANQNLYIAANNGGGIANLFSNKQTAFASIGDGLSSIQASNLYTHVQAFQTSLSRQV